MALTLRALAVAAGLSLLLCNPALAGKKAPKEGEGAAPKPANEIVAKAPPSVVQLPRMRLAVLQDENQTYRMLEVEAWLDVGKAEEASKIGSSKQKIIAAMKENFMNYRIEAFTDPDNGFALAKAVIKASVDQVTGGQPKVEEVLIRSMILR